MADDFFMEVAVHLTMMRFIIQLNEYERLLLNTFFNKKLLWRYDKHFFSEKAFKKTYKCFMMIVGEVYVFKCSSRCSSTGFHARSPVKCRSFKILTI